MSTVRTATTADLGPISRALASAFDDDPVMAHLLPPGLRARQRRLALLMGVATRAAIGHGTVWTSQDLAAAAVWLPPKRWKMATADLVRSAPASLRALRSRAPVGQRMMQAMERAHPTEPHWYLETLGTHPDRQGQGLGRALMEPVLSRCDAEGTPAYLESSKESNVPYYERSGFRVTGELALPEGGPTLWLMWRDPQG